MLASARKLISSRSRQDGSKIHQKKETWPDDQHDHRACCYVSCLAVLCEPIGEESFPELFGGFGIKL